MDLRDKQVHLAQKPLKIIGIAFLSPQLASAGRILRPLTKATATARMAAMQGYGASLPPWRPFKEKISQLALFEARRGRHPHQTVEALRSILKSLADSPTAQVDVSKK